MTTVIRYFSSGLIPRQVVGTGCRFCLLSQYFPWPLVYWATTGYTINRQSFTSVLNLGVAHTKVGRASRKKIFGVLFQVNGMLFTYKWHTNSIEVLNVRSSDNKTPPYKVSLFSLRQRHFVCVRVWVLYRATRPSSVNTVVNTMASYSIYRSSSRNM